MTATHPVKTPKKLIEVALPLDANAWRARMWLTDCARPGAATLELPDDQTSAGPPPSGWCWI